MAKEYFADNARFADLCNNILYGGREVILPENLKERDTTEVLTALGLDKKTIAVQKLRDIFKNASIKYTGKSYVVLIGVENQSDIHYSIPVKNMFYDVMAYGNQVKETAKKHRKEKDTATSDEFLSGFTKTDKLIPVITITVYLGISASDVSRIDTDLICTVLDCCDRQTVIKMNICHDRDLHLFFDLCQCFGSFHCRHCTSYDITACCRKFIDLCHCRSDVLCLCICH